MKKVSFLWVFLIMASIIVCFVLKSVYIDVAPVRVVSKLKANSNKEEPLRQLVSDLQLKTVEKWVIRQWGEASIGDGYRENLNCFVNYVVGGTPDLTPENKGVQESSENIKTKSGGSIMSLFGMDRRLSLKELRRIPSSPRERHSNLPSIPSGVGRLDYRSEEVVFEKIPFQFPSYRNGGVSDGATELILDYGVPPWQRDNVILRLNMKTIRGAPVLVLLGDYIKTCKIQSLYRPNNLRNNLVDAFQMPEGQSIKKSDWTQKRRGNYTVFNGQFTVDIGDITHLDIQTASNVTHLKSYMSLTVNGKVLKIEFIMADFLRKNSEGHSTFRLNIRDILQRRYGVIQRAELHGLNVILSNIEIEPEEDREVLLGIHIVSPWLGTSRPERKALYAGEMRVSGNSEPPYRRWADWDELKRVGLDTNNDFDGEIILMGKSNSVAIKPEIHRLILCGWGLKSVIASAEDMSRLFHKWGGFNFNDIAFSHEVIVPQVDYFIPNPRSLTHPTPLYVDARGEETNKDFVVMEVRQSRDFGREYYPSFKRDKPIVREAINVAEQLSESGTVTVFESNYPFSVGKSEFFYWGIPQEIEDKVMGFIQAKTLGKVWEERILPNKRVPVPDSLEKIESWNLKVFLKGPIPEDQTPALSLKSIRNYIAEGEFVFYRAVKIQENFAFSWPWPQYVVSQVETNLIPFNSPSRKKNNQPRIKEEVVPQEAIFRTMIPDSLFLDSLDLEYSLSPGDKVLSGCWLRANFVTENNTYEKIVCTDHKFGKINVPISSIKLGERGASREERLLYIDWHIPKEEFASGQSPIKQVYLRSVQSISSLELASFSPVAAVGNQLFYADLKSAFNRGNFYAVDVPLSGSSKGISLEEKSEKFWEGIHPQLDVKKVKPSVSQMAFSSPQSLSTLRVLKKGGLIFLLKIAMIGFILFALMYFMTGMKKRILAICDYLHLCSPQYGFYILGVALLLVLIGYTDRGGRVGGFLFSMASLVSSFGLWFLSKWENVHFLGIKGSQRSFFLRRLFSFGGISMSLFFGGAILLSLHYGGGSKFLIEVGYFFSVICAASIVMRRRDQVVPSPRLTSPVSSVLFKD